MLHSVAQVRTRKSTVLARRLEKCGFCGYAFRLAVEFLLVCFVAGKSSRVHAVSFWRLRRQQWEHGTGLVGLTPLALEAMLRASPVVAGRFMAQAAEVEADGSGFFAGSRFLSRQMFRRSVLGGAVHALLPGVRCSGIGF